MTADPGRLRRRPRRPGVFLALAAGSLALGAAAVAVLAGLPHP